MKWTRTLLYLSGWLGLAAAHALDVTFADVSVSAGIDRSTESYGASVADVNGDGYPDIFASNHRLRPSLYMNQGDGTFVDATRSVRTWNQVPGNDTHGGGFGDIDNDGDPDLLVTTGIGHLQRLFVNRGGNLDDVSTQWSVGASSLGGRLGVWHDYNRDGLLDLGVPQYAGVSRTFTNRGNGFTDDTFALNANCVRHPYAHLLDVDGDAILDYVCSGEDVFPQAIFNTTTVPWSRMTWRIPPTRHTADSALGDFDNDGRIDMFVLSGAQVRPSGAVRHNARRIEFRTSGGRKAISFVSNGPITVDLDWNLFKRDDVMRFVFVGAQGRNPSGFPLTLNHNDAANHGMPPPPPAARTPAILMGFDPSSRRWSIVTHTGGKWSDAYFEVDTANNNWGLRASGLWAGDLPQSPTLLRATAGGWWSNSTQTANLDSPVLCASVTTGDYNNDMYLDIYLACRDGASNLPNVLYYGGPGRRFRRAANASGAAGPTGAAIANGAGTAESAVSADFDLDGFLDIFVTNGLNMRPRYLGGPGKLFRNNGNSNGWLLLDLDATGSNRDAVGAIVRATAAGVTQTRVQNGGYHRWSQEHKRMHFGMAIAQRVDLVIDWPSGLRERHNQVLVNHVYRATEGGGLERVDGGPTPRSSVVCGRPDYDPSVDPGFYVWQVCGSPTWHARTVAGGRSVSHSGRFQFDVPYSAVSAISLEQNDTLDTSEPRAITFEFTAGGQWEDGVRFAAADSAGKCFTANGAGNDVFLGRDKLRVPASFNPRSGLACPGTAP